MHTENAGRYGWLGHSTSSFPDDFTDDVPTTVSPRLTAAELGAQYARAWGQPVSHELTFRATLATATGEAGLLWEEVLCVVTVTGDCDGVRDISWHTVAGDGRTRISEFTDDEREALEEAARTQFYETVEQINR
jgi:hypothetical protein